MFKKLLISTLLILSLAVPSYAVTILPYPKFQAIDTAGNPIVGGLVYTYKAGTNTPKAACATYNCSSYQTNPIVLDSRGEATIYLNGTYKIVLQDSTGASIWTIDNVRGMGTSDARVDVRDYDAVCDGVTDDSTAIQAAIDGVTAGETLYFPNKTCYLATGLVWKTGLNASFENTTLIGANGITIIDISSCSNFSFFGKLNVQGETAGATNSTYGVYGLTVANAYFQHIYGVDLPMVLWLNENTDVQVDNVGGLRVKGKYQSIADGAGSVFVTDVATRLTIGKVYGNEIYKCATYLGSGGTGMNTQVSIGSINVVLDSTSPYASAFGARSTIGAVVGEIISENGYRSVSFQREIGETTDLFKIEDISIGRIVAKNVNAVGGIGVWLSSEETTKTIGNIQIGSININGVHSNGVGLKNVSRVSIGDIFVNTSTTGYGVEVLTSDDVSFGKVNLESIANHSFFIYESSNVEIDRLRVSGGGYTALTITTSSYISINTFESTSTGTDAISATDSDNLIFGKIIVKTPAARGFLFTNSDYISIQDFNIGTAPSGAGFIGCTYVSIGHGLMKSGSGLTLNTSTDFLISYLQLADIDYHGLNLQDSDRIRVNTVNGLNVGTAGGSDVVYVDSNCTDVEIMYVVATTNVVAPLVGHRYAVDFQGATKKGSVQYVSSTGHTSGPFLDRGNAFVRLENGVRYYPRTSVSPAGGAWTTGEFVVYSDPIAAGYVGAVCITAGSPGVWKGFGALAP
jgi:hypothetical protein